MLLKSKIYFPHILIKNSKYLVSTEELIPQVLYTTSYHILLGNNFFIFINL